MKMRLVLYGPFDGFASYPSVMRGLRNAFMQLGVEVWTANISGNGDLSSRDVHSLSVGIMPDNIPSTIFAMKPTIQMGKLVDSGAKLVGLHVGDVDTVSLEWKTIMERESLVVVPSQWMREVVQPNTNTEVFVAHHGINDSYITHYDIVPTPSGETFKFLHFCSAGLYPERKGTPQVLEAIAQLPNATVTLVVSEVRRRLQKLLDGVPKDQVIVQERPSGTPIIEMVRLYENHHVLLAPSRAEGFGLQPLEARALGVPVVQTSCTGFRDALPHPLEGHGIVLVPHGPMAAAWGGFGMAPALRTEELVTAMRWAQVCYDRLKIAAEDAAWKMAKWSWIETTKPLVERLKKLDK